jgi:predicted DCC family thiol-disulfide oxidoreductase YuxK
MSTPEREYWLFWDGDCGFCRRVVAWVTRRDAAQRIRAVPYQGIVNFTAH